MSEEREDIEHGRSSGSRKWPSTGGIVTPDFIKQFLAHKNQKEHILLT
jgi:hypothetical protein